MRKTQKLIDTKNSFTWYITICAYIVGALAITISTSKMIAKMCGAYLEFC